MIDWDTTLYDPQYSTFGVEATLTRGTGGSSFTATIIDVTAGIDINAGGVILPSIKPAAFIRMSELDTKNVVLTDLLEGTIVLGANTWTIKQVKQKTGPGGKGTGEALLVLFNGDL